MKKIFLIFDFIIGHINRFIAAFGITAGITLAFANVIARYIFDYSITWASELTVYLFLWSMFFGVAYCFKMDGHITIDLFVESINKKVAKILMIIRRVVSFTFLAVVSYYGYKYLELVIELEETSIDLEIPMWIPYLVIPISFAFAAFRVAEHLFILIQTPADNIKFTTETDSLTKEVKVDKMLDDIHKKTGGML